MIVKIFLSISHYCFHTSKIYVAVLNFMYCFYVQTNSESQSLQDSTAGNALHTLNWSSAQKLTKGVK